jgi:4-aminobutyrate aminotransferase / (S)-3-amino-2-methylpropionate transaminase / 5-aminovalerate transaminase
MSTARTMMSVSRAIGQRASMRTAVPGPRSRALREREERHLAPGLQGFATMAGIVVDHARGSTVTDVDGNTFIDFIGGIGVNALGHSHPVFVKALQDQIARASVGSFTSEARVDLLERLARHRPAPDLHRLQLYSGGAEAVESALRLAKSYTRKHEFVSFWGAFHGKTMGALSLNGSPLKEQLGPMIAGNHQVPYADPYRHPIAEGATGAACVEMARKHLRASSAGGIAAIIVEPMQGTAGNVIPPADFLPAVAELAKELDALLIADEMITGFGRTGRYWGVEHTGVRPDIVTLGKAFGGGFPVSGLLTTDEISRATPWANPSGSSSSYGGNPAAAMAVATTLRIIDDEGLVDNSRRVGEHMLARLSSLPERYPFVGHVRGRGLFLGIELVRDRRTKEPLSKKACARIFHECLQRGLLTMSYAPSFRLQPALTLDEGTANHGIDILCEVLDLAAADGFWRS